MVNKDRARTPLNPDRLKLFKADLHIHTVLSGCAEIEMIPSLILWQAEKKGLNLIAITDHNACHNAEAVIEAAVGTNIHVFPGMELQSKEEVHLLCLFDTVASCKKCQEKVFQKLPSLTNKEDLFGPQYVVNAAGEWLWTEERLLAQSADMTLEEMVDQVASLGGLAIPAHVDRTSYSLLSNLGLVPPTLDVSALEVTPYFDPRKGFLEWPELREWCLIVNGDAHRLNEIQDRTLLKMSHPEIKEIILAFKGQEGRQVLVEWPKP
ncbi:MAG: PHP domain-containing protein [Deltaproteobacteria bacterium]|nr:PHP domain-containing protein [Deltaproteobacteria bacterium]